MADASTMPETFGPFRILGKLGEGGMGEVWRAEDTRLGREVAIKVLPPAFTGDAERLARFEREARALAALSHPNVAGIHEVGQEGGRHFLVMELAAGETLAERIARGPMSLAEALPIALQLATGIEAAHERGIVHRDLKPANVMVDGGGRVKILDFGLARALEPEPGSAAATGLTHSPTLTFQATIAGVLLGTAAYMSPEQAAGRPADRRADVWAFGVVLLEMLTGRASFAGETVSHVLAGVLKDEPPWGELPPDLSPRLRHLLERCLRKDPRHRLQAIGDARVVLEEVLADPQLDAATAPPAAAVAGRRGGWSSRLGWAVAGVAVVALALLAWPRVWGTAADARPMRVELPLPPGYEVALDHQHDVLAISPDGRRQAVVVHGEDGRRIVVRSLDEMSARVLPGTEDAAGPFFSPDGAWIGYFAGDTMFRVPVGGGPPSAITALGGDHRGATWSADGYIYAAPHSSMGLQRVRETGGPFETVAALDEARGERTHRWPHALPGGAGVLFTSDTTQTTEFYDDARIEVVRPATGERTVVVEQSSRARYVAGHLVFARGGALFAAPFDLDELALTGAPKVVFQGIATTVASGAAHFATAETGSLLYLSGDASTGSSLPLWVDREGNRERVGLPEGSYDQATLSPDGRRLAMVVSAAGQYDLWIADLERSTTTRLTFDGSSAEPTWSADGRSLLYSSSRAWIDRSGGVRAAGLPQPPGIWRKRADGSGEAEVVFRPEEGSGVWATHALPDGATLLVEVEAPGTSSDLWLLPLEGRGEPRPVVEAPGPDFAGEVSPDGRWLAWVSAQNGRPEVFVKPLEGAGRWQLSSGSGFEPHWSPDGRELFYRSGVGQLFSIPVEPGESFVAGPPRRLFGGMRTGDNNRSYSVAPDGSRFLTLGLTVDRRLDRLSLVVGWGEELALLAR